MRQVRTEKKSDRNKLKATANIDLSYDRDESATTRINNSWLVHSPRHVTPNVTPTYPSIANNGRDGYYATGKKRYTPAFIGPDRIPRHICVESGDFLSTCCLRSWILQQSHPFACISCGCIRGGRLHFGAVWNSLWAHLAMQLFR